MERMTDCVFAVFMSSDYMHVQWMTYCEEAILSLTHSGVSSIQPNMDKNSIYGHKSISACVFKKFSAVNKIQDFVVKD